MNEEQSEELEALGAIFGDGFRRAGVDGGEIDVRPSDTQLSVSCSLRFRFGPAYPSRGPPASLECEIIRGAVEQEAQEIAHEGAQAMMRLVDVVKDHLRAASCWADSGMTSKEAARMMELTANATNTMARTNVTTDCFVSSLFQFVSPVVN
eukprot:m51a1_g1356 hypothetical protein (151) ;mRNA; r:379689-380331